MKISGSGILVLGGVVGLVCGYEYLKDVFSTQANAQAFANAHPNLAAIAITLGFKTPQNQVPDVTGASGANTSAASQLATEGISPSPSTIAAVESGTAIPAAGSISQAYYDCALQEYAFDNSFNSSLAAQGSTGWPWVSYDAWVAAGYPALPTASLISVDANGIFSNQYES